MYLLSKYCFQNLGVLREGDELLEVNGIPLMRRSTDEIVRLMVSTVDSRSGCISCKMYESDQSTRHTSVSADVHIIRYTNELMAAINQRLYYRTYYLG